VVKNSLNLVELMEKMLAYSIRLDLNWQINKTLIRLI